MTSAASAGGADPPSGSPARMSGQGTGTAMQATVELTTLLAALTASSVVHSRMTLPAAVAAAATTAT